jgi:hypothetical protein
MNMCQRWLCCVCGMAVSCVGGNSSDKSTAATKQADTKDANADIDAASAPTASTETDGGTWSQARCYDVKSEARREIQEALAELTQCNIDADCLRTFSREDDVCWGANCGSVTMRGSDDFESQVEDVYSSDEASAACSSLLRHRCDFGPPSCPTTGGAQTSEPDYVCSSGRCERVSP